MKSRVPLGGYIAVILMYWMAIPTVFITFEGSGPTIFSSTGFPANTIQDAAFTVFLLISLIFSRIFFIPSDLENLLITGVSRWKLTGGIFFFIVLLVSPIILIADRLTLIFPLSFNVPAAFMGMETLLLYFTFILTAMLAISVGFDRALLAVFLISLLNFSSLIGNPLTMGNVGTSMYLWGLAASALLLLAILTALFFSVSKVGYAPYRIVRKRRKELVTDPIDFAGRRPERTSFRLGLLITFTIMSNYTSARGPRYSRIRTKRGGLYLLLVNVVIAVALVYLFHTPIGSTNGATGDMVLIYASFFTSLIIWNMVSLSLSQERIWLLGSTIGDTRFIRNHVLAKSLLLTILLAPTLIPLAGMAIIGHPLFLKLGTDITVTLVVLAFPSSVFGLYISGFLLQEQYVRNDMPPSGTLSFFVISLPFIFTLVAGIVTYFYMPFLLASAAVMYAVAIFLLLNDGFQQKVFHSLVYRRFV